MNDLRILVVDGSALYRKFLVDLLNGITGVEVVGTASSGRFALEKIARLKPDLVTLDIDMPEMDALEVLRRMKRAGVNSRVVFISSRRVKGSETTMDAPDTGRFDFIRKPEGTTAEASRAELERQLMPILAAARAGTPVGSDAARTALPEIVVIGISTGGPAALAKVLPLLPARFSVPVVVVQHIPAGFSETLADSLNQNCVLPVKVGEEGEVIRPGTVYIAPGDKQMKIAPAPGRSGTVLKITQDPPENNCRPSVDYLMRSVAPLYQERALAVIMTGMGSDGVRGLKLMKEQGVTVIAQDRASCVVFGMPAEAIKAGLVDVVVPLSGIAREIVKRVQARPILTT